MRFGSGIGLVAMLLVGGGHVVGVGSGIGLVLEMIMVVVMRVLVEMTANCSGSGKDLWNL